MLLVGAVGIGWHSFDLLLQTLQTSPSLFVSDTTATVAAVTATSVAESSPSVITHGHGGVLDPNAAWFALASVIIKEWLYRASKYYESTVLFPFYIYILNVIIVAIKVGVSERSEVLMANAW